MRDRLTEFPEVTIAAVTFADSDMLAGHREHLALPFPVLADPDRHVYERFGLSRGSLHRIWNLGTMRLYAQLLRRGRKLRRPTQDTRQLGGDFVIDPDGRLAAGFWPRSPDDRPTIDALITAVTAAQ